MTTQDIIVYIIVALCVWRIFRHFHKVTRCKHNGCCDSGGCAGCPLSEGCGHHRGKEKKAKGNDAA